MRAENCWWIKSYLKLIYVLILMNGNIICVFVGENHYQLYKACKYTNKWSWFHRLVSWGKFWKFSWRYQEGSWKCSSTNWTCLWINIWDVLWLQDGLLLQCGRGAVFCFRLTLNVRIWVKFRVIIFLTQIKSISLEKKTNTAKL